MCRLLILKHVRDLSDESVVEQWSENAYYQYFCGMLEFMPSYPCNASELVHFRKRIGEKGLELILSGSGLFKEVRDIWLIILNLTPFWTIRETL